MLCMKNLKIEPLNVPEFSEEQNRLVENFIEARLREWEGTPYAPGQHVKQRGVDCVHFITAIYDSITGQNFTYEPLPQDMSFHNKEGAEAGMRRLFRMYPCEPLDSDTVQAGDIVVCGPVSGGPGHGMIAGKSALWHVDSQRVCMAGLCIAQTGTAVFKQIRRFTNRCEVLQRIMDVNGCGENT